mmetsp:Transcript_97102/g.243444  ORF Transcript_97102/g.243444 Transcript_97102/m.243444 type:complete len:216 (+) Transcript_97102:55-702(+)
MAMYTPPMSPHIHDPTEPHAFDKPYEVIQKLQRDVQDLRAAFQAEQQQRAVEVNQLRQEVGVLRDQLNKECHERHGICHQLVQDLGILKSEKIKAIDELRSQFTTAVHQLNTIIQDEIRDRKSDCSLRDTREANERSERQAELGNLRQEFGNHKKAYNSFRDDTVTGMQNIACDIEMIVTVMIKASSSKGTLKNENLLCSKYFHGHGSLSTGAVS